MQYAPWRRQPVSNRHPARFRHPYVAGSVINFGHPNCRAWEPRHSVVGTVVRFTAGRESLDVTIGEDSPATRDYLSMLPHTTTLQEFNGREKIADLPRELDYEGSLGSDPEDRDLNSFIP